METWPEDKLLRGLADKYGEDPRAFIAAAPTQANADDGVVSERAHGVAPEQDDDGASASAAAAAHLSHSARRRACKMRLLYQNAAPR